MFIPHKLDEGIFNTWQIILTIFEILNPRVPACSINYLVSEVGSSNETWSQKWDK